MKPSVDDVTAAPLPSLWQVLLILALSALSWAAVAIGVVLAIRAWGGW